MQGTSHTTVEIQKPAVEELSQKSSCFKRGCVGGCALLLFIFLFSLGVLKFALSTKDARIEEVPQEIAEIVPIYSKDEIHSKRVTKQVEQQKTIEILALVPKLISTPFVVGIEWYQSNDAQFEWKKRSTTFLQTKITEEKDTYIFKWKHQLSEPEFIHEWYVSNLEAAGYTIEENKTIAQSTIEFSSETLKGTIKITDTSGTPGTDAIIMKLSIPTL